MAIFGRQRNAKGMSAEQALVASSRFVYAVGAFGIEPLNKSTGSRLLDAFHGIGDGPEGDLTNDAGGWARAYKMSPWVFRCIKIRAQTLAAVPLEVVATASKELLLQHPLSRLLGKGNSRLLYRTETDRQLFGVAYWEFTSRSLKRLNPTTIERIADRDGVEEYRQTIDGQVVARWPADRLVHFYDYDPEDDFGSVSPVSLALDAAGITRSIGLFAHYYFKNGAMPDGILVSETPLVPADRARILAEWKRTFQGLDNAHGTALLENGRITYQPITPPLKDLAMTELREETRREVAAALGVPMTIALMTEAANYATSKQDYVNFHTLTVMPELDMILDTVNQQLVPHYGIAGVEVRANVDEVEALQEDRTEVTTRNATAVSAGYLSINTALKRENEEPLKTDYFLIGGKPVPKQWLNDGDFDRLREFGILGAPEPAEGGGFPFMADDGSTEGVPDRLSEQQAVVETAEKSLESRREPAESRTIIDINVHAPTSLEAERKREQVVRDTMLKDIERWKRKVAKKGTDTPFYPDYLPGAVADWLEADLRTWDGEGHRQDWIAKAFDSATAIVKQEDDDLPSLEEFEEYWSGIGNLFEQFETVFLNAWNDLPSAIASAIRGAGTGGADFELTSYLSGFRQKLERDLLGTETEPGLLIPVFRAGYLVGERALQRKMEGKASGDNIASQLLIDWGLVDKQAFYYGGDYFGDLIAGVSKTTQDAFRKAFQDWVEAGGTLDDLAKAVEGDLKDVELPEGWSAGKMKWATSPERARLIAQTETTRIYHEGAMTRWSAAGVSWMRFRTQNDSTVCPLCRSLNNRVTELKGRWSPDSPKTVPTGAPKPSPVPGGDKVKYPEKEETTAEQQAAVEEQQKLAQEVVDAARDYAREVQAQLVGIRDPSRGQVTDFGIKEGDPRWFDIRTEAEEWQSKFRIESKLNSKQQDVVNGYTQMDYTQINGRLRSMQDEDDYAGDLGESIDTIHSAFKQVDPLEEDLIVYRGVTDAAVFGFPTPPDFPRHKEVFSVDPEDMERLIGTDIKENAFMSTSLSSPFGGAYQMEIRVPKGTHVLPVANISDVPGEQEVLLDAFGRYRVVAVHSEKKIKKGRTAAEDREYWAHRVELELIPRDVDW